MTVARRQAGSVTVVVALLLPVLLGFLALVVDLGYERLVRKQAAMACDAAALAGSRDLDGTAAGIAAARKSAQAIASRYLVAGAPVNLQLNANNAPSGDIVLGHLDLPTNAFTAAGSAMPSPQVNAVQVRVRRTAATGNAVQTFFARIFGITSVDVTATAAGLAGSPRSACGFPLVVPDCALLGAFGGLQCGKPLVFAFGGSGGFTGFDSSGPLPPGELDCRVARALGGPCKSAGSCVCNGACNATSVSQGSIYITNVAKLSWTSLFTMSTAIGKAGSKGLYVQIPVVASGLPAGSCWQFKYNKSRPLLGYATVRILSVSWGWWSPSVSGRLDCTHSAAVGPATSGIFGYRSTSPLLGL